MLSVRIDAGIYRQLKSEVSKGNISGFVEKAVSKELRNYENKLEREQKEFLKKLIAGYKRDAAGSKSKEDKMLEEIGIEDSDEQ